MAISTALYSSRSEEWATPPDFFASLHSEFRFTPDPCATDQNAKCQNFYTKADNGLSKDWGQQIVFCNPP